MERNMTCWQCIHLGDTKDRNGVHGQRPVKSFCSITHRWGSLERGKICNNFEYKQWHNSFAEDGTEIKNRQPLDYRTSNQWLESGRKIKEGAIAKEMYSSRNNMKIKYCYYLIEDTEIV